MKPRLQARTLALAALLAVGVVGGAVGQAAAKPNPRDSGVRCAYFNQDTGEWEFYLPGEWIGIATGNGVISLQCGPNGNWIRGKDDLTVVSGTATPNPTGTSTTPANSPADARGTMATP